MSNGGLRCSLKTGSCQRSSGAMTLWRSQIDAHCVCKQGPQMTSRPGPKSGTKTSKCSKSLDQNNTCSSWCEGRGPIRKAPGKRPTRYTVNFTRAEALRRDSYQGARSSSNLVGQYPVRLPHVFLCAALRPHDLPFFLQTCGYVLQTGSPNWCSRLFGHHVSD